MIVKEKFPDSVGIPEITPLLELSDSPLGNAPDDTVKVYVPAGLAVMVWLYCSPKAPLGSVLGDRVIVAQSTDTV